MKFLAGYQFQGIPVFEKGTVSKKRAKQKWKHLLDVFREVPEMGKPD